MAGQPELDGRDRTAGTGQPRQVGLTGQPGQVSVISQPGREGQNKTAMTGLLRQASWDIAGTGQQFKMPECWTFRHSIILKPK
jgi:hypothetical protein